MTRPRYTARTSAPRSVSISMPSHLEAAGAHLPETGRETAADRPGEPSAQAAKGTARIARKRLERMLQIAQQRGQRRLLSLQTLQLLRAVARIGLDGHERRIALCPRRLQRRYVIGRGALQRIQSQFVSRQLRIQIGELADVRVDGRDDAGARPAEVTVVREHASGAHRVLLIQQQFQGFLVADHVGRTHLLGKSRPQLRHVGLAAMPFGGDARAVSGALGALVAQVAKPGAGSGHRDLGGLQRLGEAIRFGLVLADFVADGGNLPLQGLELRLGARLAIGAAAARPWGGDAAGSPAATAAKHRPSTMRRGTPMLVILRALFCRCARRYSPDG